MVGVGKYSPQKSQHVAMRWQSGEDDGRGKSSGKRARKGREVGGHKQMLGRGVPQQQILTTYCNETATSPTVARLPCHLLWQDGHFTYCGEMVTSPTVVRWSLAQKEPSGRT